MYSKSQTVSPKPQNIFVTALPSSISAPSLLLLQKPTSTSTGGGAGSHRKQQTRQTSSGSGSNKNKPINNNVEQLKGDRKNSGGKNNKNRKFSNNNNNKNNIINNNNSNITTSNIVIKCDTINNNNNIENEICKTTNLFLNRLHLESSSSSSSNSTPSSSSPTPLTNNNTIDIKDQIKLDKITSKVENQQEEETFIESSFEEVTDTTTTLTFEEQFEILPISIDEETLKEYTSFINILSEIITDMCDCEGDPTNLEILRPPTVQLSTSPKIATSSLTTVEKFQVFNVDQIPEISIQAYIERVFKYLPFGTDIFIFSTIYLDRLIQGNQEVQISPLNIHRLFMASIIVASKFHNDKALNNRYYAQVGGISLSEMNQLEIHFLLLLNWKLNIDPEIFNAFKTSIQSKVDILDIKIRSNSNLDCNNNNNNITPSTQTTTSTTTTTTISTPPTVINNNNNNNINNNNICNSNNSNNNQPPQPQPPKRYVTLIEKETENKNNVVKQPPTTTTTTTNKFNNNKKGTAPTSQFSKIINNRHSNKNGYHHPNYLTYPLAAPAQTTSSTTPNQYNNYNNNHSHHQQHHQTHQQISQQHYQPYYNQQQQQYYSNYQQQQQQYNQGYYSQLHGSGGQSYEEFYPQNSYSGMYQYTSSSTSPNIDYVGDSYDSIDPSSSYGSDNFSVNSNSTTATIGGGSSMGSSNGSAPHLQSSYLPHSWQNAYYYNGSSGSGVVVGNSTQQQQQQFPYHHTPNYQ